MNLIGNIIWLIFGGLITAIEYICAGLILCFTIIGIPFGIQAFKLGMLSLWPFGHEVKRNEKQIGIISTIMNIFWLLFGGIWICITNLFFGVLLAITIIGIPFAKQHFKMAGLALTPFGRDIE